MDNENIRDLVKTRAKDIVRSSTRIKIDPDKFDDYFLLAYEEVSTNQRVSLTVFTSDMSIAQIIAVPVAERIFQIHLEQMARLES